jgi:hypothetical protein
MTAYSRGEPCRKCGGEMTFFDDGSKTAPTCRDCTRSFLEAMKVPVLSSKFAGEEWKQTLIKSDR